MTELELRKIPTRNPDWKKSEIEEECDALREELIDLQRALQGERRQSLLVVIQGMDASGKDGVVRRVFREISPSGVSLKAFKAPSKQELAHDFLWRVHPHVPEAGKIQIFNRSHYEDVLIQRVHGWIDESTVVRRFAHINHFEQLLQDRGTRVLKFYLHVSPEEQLERLEERRTDPRKMWKHNPNDFKEREHWDEYRAAYEDVFRECSAEIPWTVVPSDSNWQKEYGVLVKVVETLKTMAPQYPTIDE